MITKEIVKKFVYDLRLCCDEFVNVQCRAFLVFGDSFMVVLNNIIDGVLY